MHKTIPYATTTITVTSPTTPNDCARSDLAFTWFRSLQVRGSELDALNRIEKLATADFCDVRKTLE